MVRVVRLMLRRFGWLVRSKGSWYLRSIRSRYQLGKGLECAWTFQLQLSCPSSHHSMSIALHSISSPHGLGKNVVHKI